MNETRDPKFHTKTGKLTAYAYACGYVQPMGNGWKLFRDGCYHLRRSNAEWLTFATLTEAYAAMRNINKTTTYKTCSACDGEGFHVSYENIGNVPSICLTCTGNGTTAIMNEGNK